MNTRMYLSLSLALLMAPASGASQQPNGWKTNFSKHTVPLEEITSGGPPKDGIPAIDDPRFVPVREAQRWLEDSEPVAVIDMGYDVKAYPLQILIWHEIVNDEVGSTPVSITYCPLCNTCLAFDRRLDGRVLDFGTTGRLRHSDLVMYDRQTESWWQQATGEGIVGEYAGRQLTFISAPLVSWATFAEQFPNALVLSRETGFERPYGRNPYEGYDRSETPIPRFFRQQVDFRLPAMERVVALEMGDEVLAYPFSVLADLRVVNDEVDGTDIVILWAPGIASAVDDDEIADGRDVGMSGVFSRDVDGQTLTFEQGEADTFVDRETGSTWNILGKAVSGPLLGARLTAIPHGNHFWFAWAAFKPEVQVKR